jgi:hypothetical protein
MEKSYQMNKRSPFVNSWLFIRAFATINSCIRGHSFVHSWRQKKTGPFNLNDPACTRDGNRTRTIITDRRILSPVRLPVPPPGRIKPLNKKNPDLKTRSGF